MDPVVVSDLEALTPHLPAWRRLVERTSSPLGQPEWLLAWWRHCRPLGAQLAVVLVPDGPELAGVAPFFVRRGRGGLICAELLAAPATIGVAPVALPGRGPALAQASAAALMNSDCRPDLLVLAGVPASMGWAQLLAEAWPSRAAVVPRKTLAAPMIEVGGPDLDAWLATRTRSFRQQYRKDRRRLERNGVRFGQAAGPEVPQAVDELVRLHLQRWAARGGSAAITPGVQRSLAEAVPALVEAAGARLYVAEAAGEVVAAQLVLLAGEEGSFWLGGFDARYSADGPAMVQMVDLLGECMASGVRRFDLGAGDQAYKLRFTTRVRTLEWCAVVTAAGPRRIPAHAVAAAARAASAGARRLPPDARERVAGLRAKLSSRASRS